MAAHSPSQKTTALIALGANLSFQGASPAITVRTALKRLTALGEEAAFSGLWRSVAWPDPHAPAYVNAVMRLNTSMDAYQLLHEILAIEVEFGRERNVRWASRTLDLDLIDVGGRVCGAPGDRLELPHPRAVERAFVLAPLRDVAPGWRWPPTGEKVAEVWARLPDEARAGVRRLPCWPAPRRHD